MNYQSKFVLWLFMTSLFCISSPLLAGSKTAKSRQEEHVDAKSVQVKSNGIFMKKNGKKISVEALYIHKNGKLIAVHKSKDKLISKGYCEEKGSNGKNHGWYLPRWNPEKGVPNCKRCREKREKDDRRGKG